jgi:FMN reductase
MTRKLIFIAGSPSGTSRSTRLLRGLADRLERAGIATQGYSFRDFNADKLLNADGNDVAISRFVDDVKVSAGIVVSTPVYKATYAGSLKVVLDVIPPDALVGKVALGIATARIAEHLEGTGKALGGIFDFFRIGNSLAARLLRDEIVFGDINAQNLSAEADSILDEAARELAHALR